MTMFPTQTYIPWSSNLTVPYDNLTRLDCEEYIVAPFYTNYSTNATSSSCSDAAQQFNVALDDFMSWNPSLNGTNPCVLNSNTQYCVQVIQQVAQGVTESCVQMEAASAGFDCVDFSALHGVDPSQLVLWNPTINSDCSNFQIGVAYCVAVWHYRQPGITSNCNLFAVANDTNCE
jgi:hypothetical protein